MNGRDVVSITLPQMLARKFTVMFWIAPFCSSSDASVVACTSERTWMPEGAFVFPCCLVQGNKTACPQAEDASCQWHCIFWIWSVWCWEIMSNKTEAFWETRSGGYFMCKSPWCDCQIMNSLCNKTWHWQNRMVQAGLYRLLMLLHLLLLLILKNGFPCFEIMLLLLLVFTVMWFKCV